MLKEPDCFHVEEQTNNITTIRIPYEDSFEQSFLLSSDRHWDNPHSNQDLQKKHLDHALAINAGIIDFGDLFCAMQGKFDKRSDKSCIRPEHCQGDYLDALVNTATVWFEDYAHFMIRISEGNHESAIKKRCETDLVTRFTDKLNRMTGSSIHRGGYTGWVRFVFTDLRNKERQVINMWYTHGFGGGGPVTKGVIQTARRAAYLPDASIIVTGHIHEEWELSIVRDRLNLEGNQYKDTQYHIQVPSYKDEYGDGSAGWHIETGKPPKPVGAKWLKFFKLDADSPISFDVSRAQ